MARTADGDSFEIVVIFITNRVEVERVVPDIATARVLCPAAWACAGVTQRQRACSILAFICVDDEAAVSWTRSNLHEP
eukprot:SAG31_NODE_17066_length_684_cov_1.923077_1_plen_78_part_00